MSARRRLGGGDAGTGAVYSRPLSMEEVFDRLMQLERTCSEERAERLRIEEQLLEERAAREALERELSGQLRGMEIAAQTGRGWKGELASLREDSAAATDRTQKQLDDHKDSLNAILEVLEDTVSAEQVGGLISEAQQKAAAASAAPEGPAVGSDDLEELAGAMEELDERVGAVTQQLESVVDEMGDTEQGLDTRLAKCETEVAAAAAAAAGVGAEIERGVKQFEEKTAQLDKLIESHVEEELRGFAQSFRLAVTRIDMVVQQLDKKIEQSVTSVTTRLSEENGMLDEQIGRVAESVAVALAEAQQKLESLAADIQQFVLQVGNDKVTADARAGTAAERLEDLAVEINKIRVAAAE